MQAEPQHFLPHRNRWRNGVSNRKLLCASHHRQHVSGQQPHEHKPRFAPPPAAPVGAVPAARRDEPTRCCRPRRPGSRSRPADVTGPPTRPRQPPALGPRPAAGPASPRPGKARPPPHTDGLGPRPTGLPLRSGWGGARRPSPAAHRGAVPPPIRRHPPPRPSAARCGPLTLATEPAPSRESAAPEAEMAPTGREGGGSARRPQPPGCARVPASAGGSVAMAARGGAIPPVRVPGRLRREGEFSPSLRRRTAFLVCPPEESASGLLRSGSRRKSRFSEVKSTAVHGASVLPGPPRSPHRRL